MSNGLPDNPLARRVLEIGVRSLGSVEVAKRLNVTPVLLDTWRTGQARMPQHEFKLLIDVLLSLKPGWEEWDK